MRVTFAIMALAISTDPSAAQEAQTNRDVDAVIRAAAQGNRERMKAPPGFVNGPRAALPPSEKALGHHGTVIIEGVIDVDGRMHAARVKVGSGVAALDNIALSAAQESRFTPAKDAAGQALPVLTSMPFDLVAYKSVNSGLFEHKCDQFVRDMDWWRIANPSKPFSEHTLYKLELGSSMLSIMQAARGDQNKLRTLIGGFDTKWSAAMELCRVKPAMLQKDVIFR